MAANGIPQNFSSEMADDPVGPVFVDDEGCVCALQEALETEAWRCTYSEATYGGQAGKWFFAMEQNNPESLHAPMNLDSNPAIVNQSYTIVGEGQDATFRNITSPFNETTDAIDEACSGRNDTTNLQPSTTSQ